MGPERARGRVNNTLHRWTVNKHHPVPRGGWTELQGRVVMGIPDLFRERTHLVQLANRKRNFYFCSQADPLTFVACVIL